MTSASFLPSPCRAAALAAALAFAGALGATPALAADFGARAIVERIHATFTCADGKSIDAVFINTPAPGHSSVQLAFSDGRKLSLPQAMSADGGRYANKDESMVFWNKGNTAFVQQDGKMTYADCATKR